MSRGAPAFFISHSTKDKELADALVELLRAGLGLRNIRCTSSPEYSRATGNIADQLKKDIKDFAYIIALITPASIESNWVWLECGAAWMTKPKKIIPVVASSDLIPRAYPISGNIAVVGDDKDAEINLWKCIVSCAKERRWRATHSPDVDVKRSKFMKMLKESGEKSKESEFCATSLLAEEKRRGVLLPAEQGDEILFHTHINVIENRNLGRVRDAIKAFFTIPQKGVSGPILWSLLGSMELALTFRAAASVGEDLQKSLIGYIESSPHLGGAIEPFHYGLTNEYVWSEGRYVSGRRGVSHDFQQTDRNTHAFIRLEYKAIPQGREEAIKRHKEAIERLEKRLRSPDVHVDLYGLTSCNTTVILEMHLPCGRHASIKVLSRALEPELVYWNKDSHIVYERADLCPGLRDEHSL